MKVEKIRILATDLGLKPEVHEAVDIIEGNLGYYNFTEKGKQKYITEHAERLKELNIIIGKRLQVVLPEYKDHQFSYSRISRCYYCITIYNPDFE